MLKFPLKIEREEEVTLGLLRELAVIYVRNLVKPEGDFLDAQFKFDGEIFLTLHKGRVAKGSRASMSFIKEGLWVKVLEE